MILELFSISLMMTGLLPLNSLITPLRDQGSTCINMEVSELEKIDRKKYREYLVNGLSEITNMTENAATNVENALKLLEITNTLMAELYRIDNEVI